MVMLCAGGLVSAVPAGLGRAKYEEETRCVQGVGRARPEAREWAGYRLGLAGTRQRSELMGQWQGKHLAMAGRLNCYWTIPCDMLRC